MQGKSVLAGDLSFINLAEVFQLLGSNNSTGTLRITSQYVPAPGLIYVVDGNPVNATAASSNGLDAIYDLFGWTEGKFEFDEEQVGVERVINNSRMEIILDALRKLDDGLIKKIGPGAGEDEPAAQGIESKDGKVGVLPVIKGPIIDYMYVIDEEEFSDGDKIVGQGSHGDWIWVILEGTVEITRETPRGPLIMARLGEGCFVGTLASFLVREPIRSATVTAAGNVQLGVLDAQRLSAECASMSSNLRGLLLSLDGRLKKVTDLVQHLFVKDYKPNGLTKDKSLILKQGSSKQEAFAITEGESHVIRQTAKGYLTLLTLERTDVFGYLPFADVGHEPRRASVIATKDLKVSKIDTNSLQKEFNQLSVTLKRLIESVTTSISVTTSLACHLHEQP